MDKIGRRRECVCVQHRGVVCVFCVCVGRARGRSGTVGTLRTHTHTPERGTLSFRKPPLPTHLDVRAAFFFFSPPLCPPNQSEDCCRSLQSLRLRLFLVVGPNERNAAYQTDTVEAAELVDFHLPRESVV